MQFTLPVLSSVLLILSYPKFSQGWLAWFALAPLSLAIWRAKNFKQAALAGLTAGFFFYVGILYWIYPTMRAGGVPGPVSAFGLAALGLVLSAEFILVSVSGFYFKRAGVGVWPYIFALAWALLEYGKVLLSLEAVWFPWFMLGYTQWEYTSLIQISSVTGVCGLSAAVCFTGALAGTLLRPGRGLRGAAARFLPALAVFAFIWLYGRYELGSAAASTPSGYLNVALLQPCIDQYDKWDAEKAGGIRNKIEAMLSGLNSPDLILWPENALPGWIDDPAYSAWLKSLSAKNKSWNVVGSVSRGDGRHVSAFLLNEEGGIAASYDKRRLVPFGEYVPARGFLGKFIQPVAAMGEFSEGAPEQELFTVKGRKLGAAVCYESVFPYLFTTDVKAGADVFFNITNDGWYLDTAAPHQHFLVNIFRAVETRRPVLRAANNGISAVIDPWGRVLARKKLDEPGVLTARVPVYADTGLTFYSSRGHWLGRFCAVIVAAFVLAVICV